MRTRSFSNTVQIMLNNYFLNNFLVVFVSFGQLFSGREQHGLAKGKDFRYNARERVRWRANTIEKLYL